jgi:hypothetical protein
MYQHLRSAKDWLTKAEEAFDKEHDVRAELDLMLAQAELQHVKEVSRSRQWRYKYVLFRHSMACTLAMLMTVAIGGVYWWTNKPPVVMPPAVAIEQVTVPTPTVAKVEASALPIMVPKEESMPIEQVTSSSSSTPVVQNKNMELPKAEAPRQLARTRQPVEQPVIVSTDEMQKLVRAAGKSLRGQ